MSDRPQRIRKKKRFADEEYYAEPDRSTDSVPNTVSIDVDVKQEEESDANDFKLESEPASDREDEDEDGSTNSRPRRTSRRSNSRFSPDPVTKTPRKDCDEFGRLKRARGRPRKDDSNEYAPPRTKKKYQDGDKDPAMKQRIIDILKDAKEADKRYVDESNCMQDDIKDDLMNRLCVSHPPAYAVDSTSIQALSAEDREARVRAKIRQIQGYAPDKIPQMDSQSQKPRLYKDYLREIGREPNTPTPPDSPERSSSLDDIKIEPTEGFDNLASGSDEIRSATPKISRGVRFFLRKLPDGTLTKEPILPYRKAQVPMVSRIMNGASRVITPGGHGYVNPNPMMSKMHGSQMMTQQQAIRPYVRKVPAITSSVSAPSSSTQNKFIVTNSVKNKSTPTGIGPLRRPTLTHFSKINPVNGQEFGLGGAEYIDISEDHMKRLQYISQRISLLKDERSRLIRAQQALFNQLTTNESCGASLVMSTRMKIPAAAATDQDQRVKDHTVLRTKSDKISNRISQITMEMEDLMKDSINCMEPILVES